ncbi:aa3-type cytochrome c oxidase subunit IV [Enterovirga rhinocerotis]|uniref:Aa3 type cytochrome c oxidase subunit IV n=1 Tax=Enterovirga rhinocerotis TaxID=1339210 RepID=A0A4R7BNL2_9HYPH|nr:aa3-type cytochrome c oxidase subunit IV [Enterovirga rhinocerotis]TDR87088.1 aa3 type cytochrome c oxidase subunit IV [Enterovirga rhinocerotis]
MAHGNLDQASAYRPEMDGESHERTYDGFMHFSIVGTVFVIAVVVGLAVGSLKQAWPSAVVMILLAHIATGVGLASKTISWRAPAVVLGILLLMLLLY